MRFRLAIRDADYRRLMQHLFSATDRENAAYLLCRQAQTQDETVLLVRDLIPVAQEDVLEASATHMKIASRSYVGAIKSARVSRSGFVFVHSHPPGAPNHSSQDDAEERKLFATAYRRAPNGIHASLVFERERLSSARVWLQTGQTVPIDQVRIVGDKVSCWFSNGGQEPYTPEFFDRQIRAFGKDIQALLGRLHVGVVGLGGTGSAVTEQLTRLGVGRLTLCDPQAFEPSNVNRVYGSRVVDATLPKTKIAERHIAEIGLGTRLSLVNKAVTFESSIRELRACDFIFGCTDDYWGRSLLSRLAIYYYIPVLDMGVKIDSKDGAIRAIQGRVTTLMPGTACLFCRGRISPMQVLAQEKWELNPVEAKQLVGEGYIPELQDSAPAVVPFTTAIAASAVSEFLHRLTGYLGGDRRSSEVLHLIDRTRLRTNNPQPREECFCTTDLGRGDTQPLLGVTWRSE